MSVRKQNARKVAIVTGTCSVVGRAIAKELVLEGYCVVANGVDGALLDSNVEEIIRSTSTKRTNARNTRKINAKSSIDITPFVGDISDREISRLLVQHAFTKFGRIDVLVNNAEILGSVKRMKERRADTITTTAANEEKLSSPPYFTLEEYEFEDESIRSAYVCTREVLSEWLRNGQKNSNSDGSNGERVEGETKNNNNNNYSIINVSHCFSSMPKPAEESFTASKSGVDLFTASKERVKALTRTVALAVSGSGIRVNGIVPGIIAGETQNSNAASIAGNSSGDSGRGLPITRIGRPEEVAQVVSFLASPKASYITGAIINVDGGLALHRPIRYLEQDLESY